MDNLIDKIKNRIFPSSATPEESLKELRVKTTKLEQQAEYAETEARLIDKANKAKKRIKAVRKSNIRPLYIIAGLLFLVIIIVVMKGGC